MNKTPPIASKWNARYAYANKDQPTPPKVLIDGAAFIPKQGVALDLACGRGGGAIYLAKLGLSVHAWDISDTAIESLKSYQASEMAALSSESTTSSSQRAAAQSTNLPIDTEVRDVVALPPEQNSFDVISVCRFLDRSLCTVIAKALKPNGVLFYQTFTAGLSNPDFLLQTNELPELFASLETCMYQETPLNEKGFSEALYIGRRLP